MVVGTCLFSFVCMLFFDERYNRSAVDLGLALIALFMVACCDGTLDSLVERSLNAM